MQVFSELISKIFRQTFFFSIFQVVHYITLAAFWAVLLHQTIKFALLGGKSVTFFLLQLFSAEAIVFLKKKIKKNTSKTWKKNALKSCLPLIQNSKFNNFLWVCWFLCNTLSNFVPPAWKLHNPYCHNNYFSMDVSACMNTGSFQNYDYVMLDRLKKWSQ